MPSGPDVANESELKAFIEGGGDPNMYVESSGNALLHVAAMLNRVGAIRLLLDAEANVDIRNGHGAVPLHFVKSRQACALLLEFGASVNARTDTGDTPLHSCTDKDVAELLVESGSCVTLKNADGRSPLLCTRNRHIARYLVQQGAFVNDVCGFRCNALHFACSRGDWELVRDLLEFGVDQYAVDIAGRNPLEVAKTILPALRAGEKLMMELTIRVLELWEHVHPKGTEMTLKTLHKLDYICTWLPLRRLCRHPEEALASSWLVPKIGAKAS